LSVDKRQILDQAQKLLEKGLIDRAIKQYLRLLEVDADDVFVLQKVASLHVKNGSHAFALQYYERAFKVLKAKEFHQKCVGALKRLLEIEPARLDFHYELAKCQVALGRKKEAGTTLKSLIGVYERRGDRETSLSMLRELVRVIPEDWTNRARLAEGYAALSKDILAVSNFKQVLATLIQQNRLEDHARISERVLFLYPTERSIAIEVARNYLSRELQGEALNWLHVLFKHDPKNHQTLELLGDVFVTQGRLDKALAVFREAKRQLGLTGDSRGQVILAQKINRLDPNAEQAEPDVAQVISLTSRHPTALQPELSPASILEDGVLLIEFGLWSHAFKRLQSLPGDFVPSEEHFKSIRELASGIESIEHEGLCAEVETLTAYLDAPELDGGAESLSESIQAITDRAMAAAVESAQGPSTSDTPTSMNEFNSVPEVDLDAIDFNVFEDALEDVGTDEDEFGFEVDFDEELDVVARPSAPAPLDDFSDLLGKGVSKMVSDTETITPPVPESILATRERFPLIRPKLEQRISESGSDVTSEFETIGDEQEEDASQKEETIITDSDEEFGGLLDLDDD
jgi:tetratricopeptide (TPR) repeat protein